MKTLLIAFILLLSTNIFAQSNGKGIGNGGVWTDSLGYNDNTAAARDSVWILDTSFEYESFRIFIKGNANSSVDSIGVQAGSVRYNDFRSPIDTIWGSLIALKDSVSGNINVIINNTVGKDYCITYPGIQLLKFSLRNDREALLTRNVTLTINGMRK